MRVPLVTRVGRVLRLTVVCGVLSCLPLPAAAAVQAPVLKWQMGGAYGSFAETGWYSSPAVLDPHGTGTLVIGSGYSVYCLRGADGSLVWRARSGSQVGSGATSDVGRTWPSIALADMNQDAVPEIITAHGGGAASVYDLRGRFLPGWPWRVPGNNELRSLAVADVDRSGTPEILVGRAAGSAQNTWVLNSVGAVRSGWPQVTSPTPGYAWGIFDNNIAVGELGGAAGLEIIVPSDVHYICAWNANGAPLASNALYGASRPTWGRVGVFLLYAHELLGYGDSGLGPLIRPNFATSPATIGDLNGDGTPEVVVIGNNYDFSGAYTSLNQGPYVFNADRSRFVAPGADWTAAPTPGGAPLSEDYNVIESVSPAPALADLDGDGRLEIIYPSYDGKLRAVWLDKSEHGSWPYAVKAAADPVARFASEPVIADLDSDGKMEVLFGTWTAKGSGLSGHLVILGWDGQLLQQVPLPAPPAGKTWNGALAAPTLGNLDNDADLEIVLNTAHTGLVAYDLPGTSGARVAWGTGRGSFARTGQTPDVVRSAARHWDWVE